MVFVFLHHAVGPRGRRKTWFSAGNSGAANGLFSAIEIGPLLAQFYHDLRSACRPVGIPKSMPLLRRQRFEILYRFLHGPSIAAEKGIHLRQSRTTTEESSSEDHGEKTTKNGGAHEIFQGSGRPSKGKGYARVSPRRYSTPIYRSPAFVRFPLRLVRYNPMNEPYAILIKSRSTQTNASSRAAACGSPD